MHIAQILYENAYAYFNMIYHRTLWVSMQKKSFIHVRAHRIRKEYWIKMSSINFFRLTHIKLEF